MCLLSRIGGPHGSESPPLPMTGLVPVAAGANLRQNCACYSSSSYAGLIIRAVVENCTKFLS